MTVREFENGYWYREQLKDFAEHIGIPAATKLRKDELEKAVVVFLRTGNAALPTKRSLRRTGLKDVERGLHLKLRIENYTSNRNEGLHHRTGPADSAGCSQEARSLVSPEPLARRTDHKGRAPHIWRSRPALHCPEQDAAIREDRYSLLQLLRRGFPGGG